MNEPFVWVANEDGTLRAMHCHIGMRLRKGSVGPATHAAIFWYEDEFDESTGAYHIVPLELVYYECDEPEKNTRPVAIRPEIVISRQVISENLRNEIFERDGYKCVQCGSTEKLQIDHVHPFSKGGRTEKDNLQTLCKSCNAKKGNR